MTVLCNLSVNCVWGSWSQYSRCSRTCGSGKKTRFRDKTVTEKYGGKCNGLPSQTMSCNTDRCPSKCLLNAINISL